MIREIISRSQAKDRGLVRYYTGVPCPKGHDSERRVAGSTCTECNRNYIKAKRKTKEGWQKHIARVRKYRSGTDKGRAQRRTFMAARRSTEHGKAVDKGYRSSEEARRRSAERQAQKVSPGLEISMELFRTKTKNCQICGSEERQIVFDHCHSNHHFRGWLCHRCNLTIGLYSDNPVVFDKMAKYLRQTAPIQHSGVDCPSEVLGYG